jgi:glycosyltransferase involved in cell wall biosynthesis
MKSNRVNPTISVVIPTFQSADVLPRALRSVLTQSFSELEVIVVDDGSTDNTRDVVDQTKAVDSRVYYVYQRNQGPAVARNTGIDTASGALIAFLDADDEWYCQKLDKQVAVFQKYPEIDFVFTDSVRHNSITHQSRIFSTLNELSFQNLDMHRVEVAGSLFEISPSSLRQEVYRKNFIHLSSVLVKKEKVLEVGGFDPLRHGTEDIDLWVRLSPMVKFGYLQEVLSTHYYDGRNVSTISEKWLLELVDYHSTCLTSPDYMDLNYLAFSLLARSYKLLISYYGHHYSPLKAMQVYRQSLKQGLNPRLTLYTAMTLLGPVPWIVGEKVKRFVHRNTRKNKKQNNRE